MEERALRLCPASPCPASRSRDQILSPIIAENLYIAVPLLKCPGESVHRDLNCLHDKGYPGKTQSEIEDSASPKTFDSPFCEGRNHVRNLGW